MSEKIFISLSNKNMSQEKWDKIFAKKEKIVIITPELNSYMERVKKDFKKGEKSTEVFYRRYIEGNWESYNEKDG